MCGERMGRRVTLGGWAHNQDAVEMERISRWQKKTIARVTHPKHGTVVVPCGSKLSAIICAAEVWGCKDTDILSADVWRAEPGDVPVKMPYII